MTSKSKRRFPVEARRLARRDVSQPIANNMRCSEEHTTLWSRAGSRDYGCDVCEIVVNQAALGRRKRDPHCAESLFDISSTGAGISIQRLCCQDSMPAS